MRHADRRPLDQLDDDPFLDRATYQHQARLLRALHAAQPILHDGSKRFIHTVTAQQAGGAIEMTVYFTGSPAPIDSAAIRLAAPATDNHNDTTDQGEPDGQR